MSINTGMKTDEQWAQEGYVLVRLRDCNGGIIDPVYVKRRERFRHCLVITPREWEDIKQRARAAHEGNKRRRINEERRIRDANNVAMRAYKEQRERRLEAERHKAVMDGKISLDEMTFWDLLNNS